MKEEIYQSQIIEWSKKTDHVAGLKNANCKATASNPLCGDRISVELELAGDVIKSMACQVRGCLLCKASGSILAERVSGLGIDEVKGICSRLEGALKASDDDPESFPEGYSMFLKAGIPVCFCLFRLLLRLFQSTGIQVIKNPSGSPDLYLKFEI
jgi:NifU-like protein involved in Fe-S cluster formation